MSEQEVEVVGDVEPKVELEAPPKATEYSKEDVDEIVGEKDKRIVDLESQLKGIRKLQSEADLEVKRLKSLPQSSGNTEILEQMLKAIPQQKDDYGNTIASPEIKKLERQLAIAKQRDFNVRQRAAADGERQKMRKEAEEAGLDPDGKDLALVELAWDNNNPQVARKWLNRAIAEHQGEKPKEQEVKEKVKTEEEIRTEVTAELTAKYKIQDPISPSGDGAQLTVEQIKEMSPAERSARVKEIAALPLGLK
ncbi:hypothetical protein LCGC14_0567310 [marine sediment metagenome]|uniref:Uncharacterized protein n=1 Tax=marine sediment metagenome TaxID=412755 RepID=A0A0F9RQH3_9ZZZZ